MHNLNKPSLMKFAPSWAIYAIIWMVTQLPYRLLVFIGMGMGQLVRGIIKSRRKVVVKNLQICFPELKPKARKEMIRKHFNELGIMLTQTIKAFLGNTKRIEQTAIINGTEYLDECLKNKHGVLLVAGHFTALDMGGKILCQKYSIAGMYRPHKHPLTEYIVTKSRLKYADKMFKRDELRPIIKYLKSGGILWYAPDQDYRRGQSEFVPFFGKQASTITATHQMARLSRCKVIFFHVKRNAKPPCYTLTLSPPLDNFPTKDPIKDTSRVNQGIEDMVKINPEEYLWVHKRFKTRPKGEDKIY